MLFGLNESESIPVPIPDESIRDAIGNLVLHANALRNEAWQKEEEAIRQIESLVEGIGFEMRSRKDDTASEILLTSLEGDYEVRHAIPVNVREIDESLVASFVAANLHASGKTVDEAVANLKYLLTDSLDVLLLHKSEELGPGPKRQLSVLQSYVRKVDDAQQRTRA